MRTLVPVALVALLFAACAPPPGSSVGRSFSERAGTRAIVLGEAEMDGTHGDLLRVLTHHVTGMKVRQVSGCPELEIRGRKSLTTPTPPGIYVQGQRAANTCILTTLNPVEVSRVEAYPGGVAGRPGYGSQLGGLILIFLRDGFS